MAQPSVPDGSSGPLEYHAKYGMITDMDGRRLVATEVLPEFGPKFAAAPTMHGILRALVAELDSYEVGDVMLAEPLRLAREVLAEIGGGA